jgi:type II secretory pathway component PulK
MKTVPTFNRSGAALIVALVALVVISSLVGNVVQSAARCHRESRIEQQWLQTQFLCEAAASRAVTKWRMDSQYQGESWQPSLFEGSSNQAHATIRMMDESTSGSPRIEVVAVIESSLTRQRIQRSQRFSVDNY